MSEFNVGDIVSGKVTGVEKYGIFVCLDSNITGLIHISEISDSFVKNVFDYARIGDVISAKVIEYDSANKRMKLSIKDFVDSKKLSKHAIIETKSGFSNLGDELERWIEIKEHQISKKNQKKQ